MHGGHHPVTARETDDLKLIDIHCVLWKKSDLRKNAKKKDSFVQRTRQKKVTLCNASEHTSTPIMMPLDIVLRNS